MKGKYSVFKNKVTEAEGAGGRGFHDSPIGRDLEAFQTHWSHELFGTDADEDLVDFKVNIENNPFVSTIKFPANSLDTES